MAANPFNAGDSLHVLSGIHAGVSPACLRRLKTPVPRPGSSGELAHYQFPVTSPSVFIEIYVYTLLANNT